jgi:2-keto-4-pentenoate hydratase/2-oxohepta-3-ene-1,7-dioic acid hydratase in catechol pathway
VRLCTYEATGHVGVGVEVDGRIHPTAYDDMLALIRDGEAGLARAAEATSGEPIAVDRLLAPIPRPGTIFGSGVNYKAHADEEPGAHFPSEPRIDFIKLASAVIGPGAPIVIPPHDRVIKRPQGFQVDYEVEFGVVIGKTCKNATRQNALDHVFGYTLVHDVGSRAVQFGVDPLPGGRNHLQADLGKNFDTFAPMGPVIVTKDEFPDLTKARIRCWVNGELRQEATLAQQIFPIPVVIEWISSIITLQPGDILSSGTPGGIGAFMDPPQYLKPGDVVTIAEDTIGELTNPIVAGG